MPGWLVWCLSVLFLATGAVLGYLVLPEDDAWSDPDAVIVLGGNQSRARQGLEMARAIDAPLFMSASAAGHGLEFGYECNVDFFCLVPDPITTAGEAQDARFIANYYGFESILVITSDYHTARARMLFRQCLGDRVAVISTPTRDLSLPRQGIAYLREGVAYLVAIMRPDPC